MGSVVSIARPQERKKIVIKKTEKGTQIEAADLIACRQEVSSYWSGESEESDYSSEATLEMDADTDSESEESAYSSEATLDMNANPESEGENFDEEEKENTSSDRDRNFMTTQAVLRNASTTKS